MLRDSQGVQRQSLEFVRRNFAPDAAGFHPKSGLFCGGTQKLGVWLSQGIYQTFGAERDEAAERRLMEAFRSEPVHYLVESFRLRQFPPDVRRFWASNYQPYRASVFVAGADLIQSTGRESDPQTAQAVLIATALSGVIGAITFWGSLIALLWLANKFIGGG